MTIKKVIASITLAAAIAGTAHSGDTPPWRDSFDLSRADLERFTMVLMNDGKAAGSMTYGWTEAAGQFIIRDRSEMAPNILETAEATIAADSLLPVNVAIDFSVGDNRMDLDLKWQGSHRAGTIVTVRNGQETNRNVNVSEEEAAPLRMAVIGMVAALPLEPDFKVSLPWFNSMANRTEQITLEVMGEQTVETPAGTFDSWQVAIKGGMPENIAYVSKALPQRIVRIDVVGQPMHFLLTKNES